MASLVRDHPEATAVLIVNEFAALGSVAGLSGSAARSPTTSRSCRC